MAIRNKLIYICSPLAGDMEANIKKAIHYCKEAIQTDPKAAPIAPHIYCTQFLNDNIPAERAAGLDIGLALLEMCSEIWVYGFDNPSEGMKAEIQYAYSHNIKIVKKTRLESIPEKPVETPKPTPEQIQNWKDSYFQLHQSCPELFSITGLRKKLADLRNREHDFNTKSVDERTDYYACIAGLEAIIADLSA